MDFDSELRQLKNSYRDISRQIDRYISDGERMIRDIEKSYSDNVGKVESLIDSQIENIEKQIDEIVRSYEKEVDNYKSERQKGIRILQQNYIQELKTRKQQVIDQISVNLRNAMTIKGEL